MSDFNTALIQQLDDSSKQEILKFVEAENSKSKIQMSVHNFTDKCFSKCVTGPITSGQLSKSEEGCMNDCLNRFLDVNIKVVQQLQNASR